MQIPRDLCGGQSDLSPTVRSLPFTFHLSLPIPSILKLMCCISQFFGGKQQKKGLWQITLL